MPNPIPGFDHNLVLPPHLGDPVDSGHLSPYPCTALDLCQRFGTSPERRSILGRFLDFREFASPMLSKSNYNLDHYVFDAGFDPKVTMEQTRYWILLFSHNRFGVWKGMLRIELNTPTEDGLARQHLEGIQP